jgi:hypothetical protein
LKEYKVRVIKFVEIQDFIVTSLHAPHPNLLPTGEKG